MTYLHMIGPWQIIILITILFLIGIIPMLIALIDVLKNKFEGNNKIVWVFVILFLNIIGAILYFTIGRSQRIKNK
ncbi:PLD nuclease N-terminal domain-containing protein [Lutibacter sp. A80]|uniref:PLD nuclease N-terminal domain-containing protein n=1 Tax=Lutibacter sp. A80 TaxID=2918453 RepID=UPI001F06B733|nr:PLD nuclease N-terminal domain-containing protein [Lutibacter sp. A80]UMB60543.1 PLD nuclease N-terminal domain-containing protein [Lutibacter sp. A80]